VLVLVPDFTGYFEDEDDDENEEECAFRRFSHRLFCPLRCADFFER
jgi:hypothetical protein